MHFSTILFSVAALATANSITSPADLVARANPIAFVYNSNAKNCPSSSTKFSFLRQSSRGLGDCIKVTDTITRKTH